MQDTGQLHIGLRGVAHILRDQSLHVPAFQRNYSWTREQIDEYWFDLKAALTADQPLYFLGTVVLGRAPGNSASVIDGQQRLATTSMLLAAIRNAFRGKGDERRAETIQSMYLAAPSLSANRTLPKLNLNDVDQAFFESHVLELPVHSSELIEDRRELRTAFDRLTTLLTEDVESAGPKWDDRLLRWIQLLEERTQVITVSVADDADAFVIFETLNDRGVELSVADLIKNYLLGLSRDEIASAQELWISTNRAIEEVASSKEVTPFIRQWWSSKQGATRERDLYKSLRGKVASQDEALATLRDMTSAAPAYAALLDSRHELWGAFPREAQHAVSILIELGFEQYRPLAIAAIPRLDEAVTARLLSAVVNWSIRGLIVGGIGGGSAERSYAEAAVRVTNGRAKSVESVYGELEGMVATDREFLASFAERRVLRASYLRYLLHSLHVDKSSTRAEYGEYAPVAFFPRSDDGAWDDVVEPDERKQLSARIGNYALIPVPEVGDVPLDPAERLRFFESKDALSLSIDESWDIASPDAVNRRQMRMGEKALHIWPVVPSSDTPKGE